MVLVFAIMNAIHPYLYHERLHSFIEAEIYDHYNMIIRSLRKTVWVYLLGMYSREYKALISSCGLPSTTSIPSELDL